MAEAKTMYVRTLKGYKKAWDVEHTSTLDTIKNLRNLYKDQDKLAKAKKMFEQMLKGFKKIYGVNHSQVLVAISNLSLLKSARK